MSKEKEAEILITKREARAMMGLLAWGDAAFGLGKTQKQFRQRLVAIYPDLKEVFDE